MSLEQIKKEIESKQALLLDVREKKEWDKDHLNHAIFFPLSELKKGNFPIDIPQDKKIYTHCQAGGRAEQAAIILNKSYIAEALKISFDDLKKAGL